MPLHNRLQRMLPQEAGELSRLLQEEWEAPTQNDKAPIIILEGGTGRPIQVYVIWDQWQPLNMIERSEVIMQVVEKVQGREEAMLVTVAMGLTKTEARNMGIDFSG